MNLGESLKQWREYRRYSVGDLVRLSGVPEYTIRRVENGTHTTINWEQFSRLAQTLGLETLEQVRRGPHNGESL